MQDGYVDKKMSVGGFTDTLRMATNCGALNCVANSRSSVKGAVTWTVIPNKGTVTSRHYYVGPIGEAPCAHTLSRSSTRIY